MASETIKCPNCEAKVKVSDVEKEDGLCPECGQLLVSSSLASEFDDGPDELDADEQADLDGEYTSEDDEDDTSGQDDEVKEGA